MKKVIPFTIEHGRALDITMPLRKLHIYTEGPSYSLLVNDKIVCAFGVLPMWNNVGTAWGMLGPDFYKHSIFVTRTIRRILKDIQRAFNFERIEAQSIQDKNHERWLELVGFKREYGVARKYTDGKSAVRFELIKGDTYD